MKDPAFLFYPNDFTIGTQFFTDEQTGKYIRLLCAQHQHGHLTEKQVLSIIQSHDPEIMLKFNTDDNGKFFNERLEKETEKRAAYSQKQRERIQKRWSKSKSYHGNTTVIPRYIPLLEDENENVIINNNKNKKSAYNFPESLNTPKFKETWIEWEKHRVEIKKKLTPLTATRQMATLAKLSEPHAIATIEKSIESGWTGLFPDKIDLTTINPKQTKLAL